MTKHEHDIVALVAAGYTDKIIARALDRHIQVLGKELRAIRLRLGARNRTNIAVKWALHEKMTVTRLDELSQSIFARSGTRPR